MSFAANLPLFSVVGCLLASAVSAVLRAKPAAWVTRILAALVAAASVPVLLLGLKTGTAVTYTMGHFPAPWGNELRFGILEPLVSGIFALVLLACVVGGDRELKRDIEPGTVEAFKGYVACLQCMYQLGMAVQLKVMGYHMTKL